MRYSYLKKGTIIHIVGGRLDDDLKFNIPEIARWFVENDITPLWGDDFEAQYDKNHPVKLLIDEIVKQSNGTIKPIRLLQLGKHYDYSKHFAGIPLTDENDAEIGYLDTPIKDQVMIYTHQQQDRQKAYYNITDGLLALNGGVGVGYEQVSSFLYTLTGDLPEHFKIMTIDHDGKFKKFLKAYLDLLGADVPALSQKYFADDCYFKSATDFVDKMVIKANDYTI